MKRFILPLVIGVLAILTLIWFFKSPKPKMQNTSVATVITLTDSQIKTLKIAIADCRDFVTQRTAVGNIDVDANETVAIFPAYAGRIKAALVNIGDVVKAGQILMTIDSADLLTAESTLLSTAATLATAEKVLKRDTPLFQANAIPESELEQAIANQRTSTASFRAAREMMLLFGKTSAEIEQILKTHRIDSTLAVRSPFAGRVTQRFAVVGQWVQAGVAPAQTTLVGAPIAPYTLSKTSELLILMNVDETDTPLLRIGQTVTASVMADPQLKFTGKIKTIAESSDPTLHTVLVQAKIENPAPWLRAGMLATVIITISNRCTIAVGSAGVVREGDGSMTVWIAQANNQFEQRTVKIGLEQGGFTEILAGVKRSERVVGEGAIFLDNMLASDPEDIE